MDRHVIIITTDKRQEALARSLKGERRRLTWEEYYRRDICEKLYVLPTPVKTLDAYPRLKACLKEEFINCKGPIAIFGGAFTEEWIRLFEAHGIIYWDFMKMPEVTEGNGWITAEATVAEILNYGNYSLLGQRVLVTGYGCCGEKIGKLLKSMGAKVTVAARREEVRYRVAEQGMQAISFAEMPSYAHCFQTVINTVPSLVLREPFLEKMSKDGLIIDIASDPGGTDFDVAKQLGILARLSTGLPGKYTTASSGQVLKNAILKRFPLMGEEKGEHTWIFQITT